VAKVRRNAVIAATAVVSVAAGAAFAWIRRRGAGGPEPGDDPRAEELRRKLAEARGAPADEDEFQAAGMGAETIVEEAPAAEAETRPPSEERPPSAEFEELRRQAHEEGRAAVEEMRKASEPPA
jgi:hypothetical protein